MSSKEGTTSSKRATNKSTKKAAPKKAAPKKAATKRSKATDVDVTSELSLEELVAESRPPVTFQRKFSDEDAESIIGQRVLAVRSAIAKLVTRTKKRRVNIVTPSMLQRMLVPLPNITWQYAIESMGMRQPSMSIFVGPEGVGKTSWLLHMAGHLLRQGAGVVFIDCENKPPSERRALRLLDRSPRMARLFYHSIVWAPSFDLVDFERTLRETVSLAREQLDSAPATKGAPLFVLVDNWTTLMSDGESQGRAMWAGDAEKVSATDSKSDSKSKDKKKEVKELGSGSNMLHAKHGHATKRILPALKSSMNVSLLVTVHQTDKVEMTTSKAARPVSAAKNANFTGGKGLRQAADYVYVMSTAESKKHSTEDRLVKRLLRFYVFKNSFGAPGKSFYADILFAQAADTKEYLQDPISYAEPLARWLLLNKLLGLKLYDRRYSSDVLGLTAGTAEDLVEKLKANPGALAAVGAAMGIEGYETAESVQTAAALQQISEEQPAVARSPWPPGAPDLSGADEDDADDADAEGDDDAEYSSEEGGDDE